MTTSLNFSNSGNSYDPEAAADEFQYFLELSDRQHLLSAPAPVTDEWPELDAEGNLPLEGAGQPKVGTEIDGLVIGEWSEEIKTRLQMGICHGCWEWMEPGQKFVHWHDQETDSWLVVHLPCWERWSKFVDTRKAEAEAEEPQDFYEPGERARYYDHDYMGYGPSENDGPDGYEDGGESEEDREREERFERALGQLNWSGHPVTPDEYQNDFARCDHCGCEFRTLEALHDHQSNDYADCDGTLSEYDRGVLNAKDY